MRGASKRSNHVELPWCDYTQKELVGREGRLKWVISAAWSLLTGVWWGGGKGEMTIEMCISLESESKHCILRLMKTTSNESRHFQLIVTIYPNKLRVHAEGVWSWLHRRGEQTRFKAGNTIGIWESQVWGCTAVNPAGRRGKWVTVSLKPAWDTLWVSG